MSDLFRSGRGGAGNFHTRNDLEELKRADDIESQVDPSSSTSINDLTRSLSATNPPPEYLHTGRGGAGNWVQPRELHSQGLTQGSSLSGSERGLGSAKPTYRGGRGGAGNYGSLEEEERLRVEKKKEERKREEVERRVERDVEVGLARPERAYGGKGGSWEMGSMSMSMSMDGKGLSG